MLRTVYGRIHLQTTKPDRPVLLGGDFNAPKRETEERTIVPHGSNAGQYTNYPDYGHPYYFAEDESEIAELEFAHRRRQAERRLFDSDAGDWPMRDVYWATAGSSQADSTDDYTHKLPKGSPERKRLDHIFVSSQFDVQRCDIWNGRLGSVDGFCASDHAPVVATMTIDA
jgi:endonuclease/exonuclease/phosphatase family metal-dependent hydrolase